MRIILASHAHRRSLPSYRHAVFGEQIISIIMNLELNSQQKMQERHRNRILYFEDLSITCGKYFIPYIQQWHKVEAEMSVMEIGCGEGGNLLPFSKMGCRTTGVDIATCRIEEAKCYFEQHQARGEFIAEDIFKLKDLEAKYDVIICHDVIEHINSKEVLLLKIGCWLKADGVAFVSFPAWQMPFGGHQQICRHRLLSHLPFIHLLPAGIYRTLLRLAGESPDTVAELLDIKQTGVTIERFERQAHAARLSILHRQLWLINPHYQIKFKLPPRRLPSLISRLPYLRNFFCTTCFYILSPTE